MRNFTIHQGHVLDVLRGMESESVHCVVTSPPYWGLRDYGVDGQIGMESTPDDYAMALVGIFQEVKRVLRSDGTCFLNLGDSYCGYWGDAKALAEGRASSADTNGWTNGFNMNARPKYETLRASGIKPKDLVGIPWRVAFALQADGWWLRSDIIWNKPNPMPESVTDRPTKSHEYIFLLTKSERYFFDAEAVKEPLAAPEKNGRSHTVSLAYSQQSGRAGDSGLVNTEPLANRNIRSVWSIATSPFPDAHFAVFPPEIPRRCILAGTSERGVCAECGAPWARKSERSGYSFENATPKHAARLDAGLTGAGTGLHEPGWRKQPPPLAQTIDWQPSCKHNGDPIPATVLDPFCGAGTTGLVALRHGRNFIGIELNPAYVAMAEKRIAGDAPLFNTRSEDSLLSRVNE